MSKFQIAVLAILGLIAFVVIAAVGMVAFTILGSGALPVAPPPGPTSTPGPTPTPAPTATPIIYDWEGQGDDVIFFDAPKSGPGLMNAWYGGDSNFSITLYRANGDYIDLLVNTIDEYEGKTTYRVGQPGQYYLEIKADGDDYVPKWHILMAPPQ